MQVTEFSLGVEMMLMFIHCQVDLSAQALDEHGMPVLVVQQAAQGEAGRGVRGGQFSITLEEKNNSTMIPSFLKKKVLFFFLKFLFGGPESPIMISISFHALHPKHESELTSFEYNILSTLV